MSQQIIKDHNLEALKVAASWPGADRATLVTLATVLAATGADHDGLRYFEALAASQPDQVLPLSLAGYFQVRAGEDISAGLAKLDDAASRDLGPAQYYRGLALAALSAARTLLAQRDHILALDIITAGLASHPDARDLAQLRQQALYRLMEQHQLQDPFRFLIYAELAGVEIGPVARPDGLISASGQADLPGRERAGTRSPHGRQKGVSFPR